ncbi:MAG: lipopolysaccharide biosynthesis protein [Verrucomicrobiales bacterium]|nr:lipopolysaccharide biosynthesis protein [Verrucomicrobiales bacterium]
MADLTSSFSRLFHRGQISRALPGNLFRSALPAALRFSGAGLQLITAVLIARGLGVKESGVYFFWTAAMMEAGRVATFGLDRIALQQVPRLKEGTGETEKFLAPLRATSLLIALVISGGLSLYALFTDGISGHSFWWCFLPPVCVLGVTMSMINAETMVGLGRPVLAILYRHSIVAFVLCPAILLMGERLTAELALAVYAGAFFLSGFGAFWGPGFSRSEAPLRIPSGAQFTGHLKEGGPIFLSYLFSSLAFIVPLIILERTNSGDQISIVTTSFRIFVLVDVLARAVHSLVMPGLSLAAHEKQGRRIEQIYRGTVLRGFLIMGVPVLGILFFGRAVMEVFGRDFGSGTGVLQLFMIFALLSVLLGPAHQLLLMVGRTRQMAGLSLIQCVFTSVLGLALVPRFGAEGLAIVIGAGVLLEKVLYLLASWQVVSRQRSADSSN